MYTSTAVHTSLENSNIRPIMIILESLYMSERVNSDRNESCYNPHYNVERFSNDTFLADGITRRITQLYINMNS